MANSVTRTLLLQEAARRGWKTETIGAGAAFLKITHPDGRWEMFRGSEPKRSSAIGQAISKEKHLTLDFVRSYGYAVPEYALVRTTDDALAFLQQHGTMVLKPTDGQRSEGVTVNITDVNQLEAAVELALKHSNSKKLVAQRHLDGNMYRLLVLDGKMIAATWRTGLAVTGDGESSVGQLMTAMNLDPRRGVGGDLALTVINTDSAAEHLGEDGLTYVPAVNESVSLADMDTVPGGGAVAVTHQVHDDWRYFAEHMSQELGLFICGFDFICEDISQPIADNYVPILELNAAPGFRIHQYPTGGGEPVEVAPLLLDALFPAS